MKINLRDYLAERELMLQNRPLSGPVITISRNYGCDDKTVVHTLINKLNHLHEGGLKKHPWSYIDREIMEDSAKELGINTHDLDHRVLLHNVDHVSALFASFTHKYVIPDKKILQKVQEIILTYATKGNVIIIGRGGIGVTKSMKNSLHIKLGAPLDFRIAAVSQAKNISTIEAEEYIKRMDKYRKDWAEHLIDKPLDSSVFDVIFNMETTSIDEITNAIVALLQKRGLVGAS
jgi:cytidylate kinase